MGTYRGDQANRVRALWKRQLVIPLIGMEDAWATYKGWEEHNKVRRLLPEIYIYFIKSYCVRFATLRAF